MLVTLDQLKPYDFNPRVTRNPKYEEIKASIRQRGLDAPPSITRRPGESHYRIRNGGNTRLSILRELWSETKAEQFFRLTCTFRPWPKRGEIVALTGHLAENELRGGLTFIERALGIEKARELYEQECGSSLSQSELARRLTADGYPIHQSHISRMKDAVEYLLPAIPNVLYGGLGRHQVERLAVMRRSLARVWDEQRQDRPSGIDFPTLFHESLLMFDGCPSEFNISRAQDEIIGQMALSLGVDYDTLALASEIGEKRVEVLLSEPQDTSSNKPSVPLAGLPTYGQNPLHTPKRDSESVGTTADNEVSPPELSQLNARVQSTQTSSAKLERDDLSLNSEALPFTQGSLFPIADIWNIEPGLDEPRCLRAHISQFAREICQDEAQIDLITDIDDGIGFRCCSDPVPAHETPSTLVALLETFTSGSEPLNPPIAFRALFLGSSNSNLNNNRLSDASLVKLFRLIRLARRLIDLGSENEAHGTNIHKEIL